MHLILIDASAFIFRAYHALPSMQTSKGVEVGAVSGFCSMLYRLLGMPNGPVADKATHASVIFDGGGRNWRHDLYPEYKAHRPAKPSTLTSQFDLIKQAVDMFGLHRSEVKGQEADDVIASYTHYASQEGYTVTIVTPDKDLLQLVDEGVEIYDPVTNGYKDRDYVLNRYGVYPAQLPDLFALAGDASDGIPGVPSIGLKRAAGLLKEFGTLEFILEQPHRITNLATREAIQSNKDLARTCLSLVLLGHTKNIAALGDLTRRLDDPTKLLEFCEQYEFISLAEKIKSNLEPIEF